LLLQAESIGKSYEGRETWIIRLEKAGQNKPNVWIEAGKARVLRD